MTKVETCGPWTKKFQNCFFIKSIIPALKYGRCVQIEAANTFIEFIKKKHADIKLSNCGLFVDETLPNVGGSPDRILLWIFMLWKGLWGNQILLFNKLCDGNTELKKSNKYYTQCMLQMAVTETIKNYFVVWTPHEMIMMSYNEFWSSVKNKFQNIMSIFLRSSFSGYSHAFIKVLYSSASKLLKHKHFAVLEIKHEIWLVFQVWSAKL